MTELSGQLTPPKATQYASLRLLVVDYVLSARTLAECARAAHLLVEYVAATGDEGVLTYGDQVARMADANVGLADLSPDPSTSSPLN